MYGIAGHHQEGIHIRIVYISLNFVCETLLASTDVILSIVITSRCFLPLLSDNRAGPLKYQSSNGWLRAISVFVFNLCVNILF